MGVGDFVAVVVSLSSSKSPTRQGFGTPLLVAYFDPTTRWQGSGDRIRFYAAQSALTQLVADGFATTDPIYRAFLVALSQNPTPQILALGRAATAPTQILKMTCLDAVAGGVAYAVTIVGKDGVTHAYTWANTGVPATDAATGAAAMTASNIGTVTVAGGVITITQSAGALTDLQAWSPNLSIQDATTDTSPSITADLAAISAVNSIGWYSLSLACNSKARILAAQTFVEATGVGGKFGFYDNADTHNVTTATDDVFTATEGLTYNKMYLEHSSKAVLSFAGFGMASQILGQSPGSYALSYKSLPGVVADDDHSLTETQRLILNTASTSQPGTGGKNGNYYATVSGLNVTWPGVAPSGEWCDVTIFLDWLQSNLQADVFAVLAGLPKVPFTDFGIGLIAGAIKTRLKIGASPPYGGIDGTRPITVNVPTAANVAQGDRNNRNLSGLSATAFLSGAVNTAGIQVTVTQ